MTSGPAAGVVEVPPNDCARHRGHRGPLALPPSGRVPAYRTILAQTVRAGPCTCIPTRSSPSHGGPNSPFASRQETQQITWSFLNDPLLARVPNWFIPWSSQVRAR